MRVVVHGVEGTPDELVTINWATYSPSTSGTKSKRSASPSGMVAVEPSGTSVNVQS